VKASRTRKSLDGYEIQAIRAKLPRVAAVAAVASALLLCCIAPAAFASSTQQDPAAPVVHAPLKPEPMVDVVIENFTWERPARRPIPENVAALLAKADECFQAGRVADPPEDSAYGMYLFVLGLDPDNEIAQAGVKKVEEYYLALGRGYARNERYEQAIASFRKALLVNADDAEAELAVDQLETLIREQANESAIRPAAGAAKLWNAPPETPAQPDQAAVAAMKATIKEHMGRVNFCFAKNPDAKGVASIRFSINPDGSVSNVALPDSTLGNSEIEQCLLRRVALMRFPTFAGAPRTVVVPFRFNQ